MSKKPPGTGVQVQPKKDQTTGCYLGDLVHVQDAAESVIQHMEDNSR